MITSVEEYLSQLRKQLVGCDPAIIQDALADTEEHLRTALSDDPQLQSVIEKYGSPEEVAAEYKYIEERMPLPLAAQPTRGGAERSFISRFFGVFAETRVWAALFYLLLTLGTGIAYFTWVVTGLSVSAGLLVLVVGLPILVLFLLSVRGLALIEGRVIEALLGIRMPRRSRYTGIKTSWSQKIKGLFSDRTIWTSMVYMVFLLPFGIFYFTLFVTLIAVSLGLVAMPFMELIFKYPVFDINDTEYHISAWLMPVSIIAGILLLTLTMHLVKVMRYAHGRIAKSLLVAD